MCSYGANPWFVYTTDHDAIALSAIRSVSAPKAPTKKHPFEHHQLQTHDGKLYVVSSCEWDLLLDQLAAVATYCETRAEAERL